MVLEPTSSSVTWGLIRNENSFTNFRSGESETLGEPWAPSKMFSTSPPGDSNAHLCLRTTGLAQIHPHAKFQPTQCYCKDHQPKTGLVLIVICPHFIFLISVKHNCNYDVIINCFMSVSLHS